MKKNNFQGANSQGEFSPLPSINFHLWKPCNMRCHFCFATFDDFPKGFLPKGHLPEGDAIHLVESIAKAGFQKITFAGGEPLLCPWLDKLLAKAKSLNLTTMIVTNGYRISREWLAVNACNIDWITLSIDSLNDDTNLASGRAHAGRQAVSAEEQLDRISWIKSHGIRFKMNTVVHRLNQGEDMNEFVKKASPERWKLFQVLPVEGQNSFKIDDLLISNEIFEGFVERHQASREVADLIPESNDAMTASYVMVDPAGRFFDNSKGKHTYSDPILEVGIETAYLQVCIDQNKFSERGGLYEWGKTKRSLPLKLVLGGFAGSGKSSVGRALAERLGYKFVSAGKLARDEAASRGVSIQELQVLLENESEDFDQFLDRHLTEWGRINEKWIMDYRMGFHMLPEACSVFLDVSAEEAAKRISLANRTAEFQESASLKDIQNDIGKRNVRMQARFKNMYGVDFGDSLNYDIVIQTEGKGITEIANEIIEAMSLE